MALDRHPRLDRTDLHWSSTPGLHTGPSWAIRRLWGAFFTFSNLFFHVENFGLVVFYPIPQIGHTEFFKHPSTSPGHILKGNSTIPKIRRQDRRLQS